MNNTAATRRPATDADLYVGALVFKGKGSIQYRVTYVSYNDDGTVRAACAVKATTNRRNGGSYQNPRIYTVEA